MGLALVKVRLGMMMVGLEDLKQVTMNYFFDKNINEDDNEILQVEAKAQQGSCNWNSINNYGSNGTKLQIHGHSINSMMI
jgi:hypothetical protein